MPAPDCLARQSNRQCRGCAGMIIGILGSGQLGRMLAIAAAQLGIKTHIFAPDASTSPAGDIAFAATEAAYDDHDALVRFANSVDVITSEFENVPATTLDILAIHKNVSPGIAALHGDFTAGRGLGEQLSK